MGASGNPPIIATSQSARSRTAEPAWTKCAVPGNSELGLRNRPSPPSRRRRAGGTALRRARGGWHPESPMMSKVGASIPRISSCGQAKELHVELFQLGDQRGEIVWAGRDRRYSSSIGDPANASGVMDGIISSNSGCMPSLVEGRGYPACAQPQDAGWLPAATPPPML